jgi:class 3 adenylate cyclase
VELGVLGPLQVRQYGLPVAIPGAKPRAILTMLGLHGGSVVSADTLVELLWGDDPPRTAAKALQTHISALRRTLGDGFVLTEGTGWTLNTTEIDATRYKTAARLGRDAFASGDAGQAVARFDEALTLWRGIPELPDGQRGVSEKTRWVEGHAALVEDRADALLATGRAAEIIGELEAAIGDAPLRERRWGQLMLALYRAGRQGEALGAYQRARSLLADELGVDPGPDLRRLETAIVAQDDALELPVAQQLSVVTRAVTFLLTDIEGSTAAWEADADAMAAALARHDEIVEQVVTSRGGRLIKTRGEGDATFSVFDRPSSAAAAAIELQEAIRHEPWALPEPMRIRVALHTGEVELRDGDYFGRAVNRAARLRSLATGGLILCSGATAELVIDTLSEDVVLTDLGMRQLRNLARPEHVFELRLETADDSRPPTIDAPMERPDLPAVLAGPGPFVGRSSELERLLSAWQMTLDAGTRAVLIAGEPGVGKTRLAGEWSRQAYEQGAIVLYGRCDEDLGAPYQPFAEALRSLAPSLGPDRLRGLRGVEALIPLIPGLTDALPDIAAPARADAETERYALFDAVVALLGVVSANAPVVLILDDLHWAAKPTLLLLRHLLRFGEHARVQIVGTYRSTDLDRSHPLAAMLADLHRDGSASRLQLSGLDEDDVTAYVAEAGYDDEELARALASVTGGNPFFLIEALRHVDESGGRWDPSTLPQGIREAVSRRLSRLPAETNKALAAAAVVGSRFALDLVERVTEQDLVDAFDEACKAGIVIEEPGGRYRFNHALVRQSLLAELASVRRMRLHQRIAATLETEPGAHDELLAEVAYHYFECAWAGNAGKAVEYCRRAADQAMARLAYEGAADLYDKALHALEDLDEELPDRDDQQAELLVARCEALLAAGDVGSATGAVSQLQSAAGDSARLAAWGTCFDGQLSMLTDPERLDEIESAVSSAAAKLAGLDDAAGEAKAHTVRASCLARLGRIGDCETALDQALTAARQAREHRRVNAVLAGAPLAALWGPNPVPRAGGRCLDVVRLLRITTGSPVVEATSTRCQGVLDAFRGRAAAGRQLIDSARRSLTELGMRHALLEVDQFAGIVELVADDPAAAEPYLRRAYNGFRRMGLDADTAETAALLARACLALDRDTEADELCAESARLAGHALKASIAWRTVRAQLLARGGDHEWARRVAEEAVAVAEHTDLLVDHGDACLALATVLGIAGDAAGARAAAEQAVGLYERKGAAALAENARGLVGGRDMTAPAAAAPSEAPSVELVNACVRTLAELHAAVDRGAWDDVEFLLSSDISVRSHRKIVGFSRVTLGPEEWTREAKRLRELGFVQHRHVIVAVRGERLALTRTQVNTADTSAGAPQDELLRLIGLDNDGRIAMDVWFDIDDMDAALAELDAAHARLDEERPPAPPLSNAASRVYERVKGYFATRDWDAMANAMAENVLDHDRRHMVNAGIRRGRDVEIANGQAVVAIGGERITSTVIATRGGRIALCRTSILGHGQESGPFCIEFLSVVEIDADERLAAHLAFDLDDFNVAFEELDARYLAGEAADHAHTWSVIAGIYVAYNRGELPATTPDVVSIDHRRVAAFAVGEGIEYIRAGWDRLQHASVCIETVHRVSDLGAVFTWAGHGTAQEGFAADWRGVNLVTVDGEMVNRSEVFDEADLDAAIARFEQLSRPAPRLENAASQVTDRFLQRFAARDWDAMAQLVMNDISFDDRRPVVNASLQIGRDLFIENFRIAAELDATQTPNAIATRGERLVLSRARFARNDGAPEEFGLDLLHVIEIDADNRIAATVTFCPDDIAAAFEELDARYLAGEAAAHAHTWSVISAACAALNRRELSATTPDYAIVDHRLRTTIEAGDLTAYVDATWNLTPELRVYIEAVHRLSHVGAVITLAAHGTSQEGFDAQWQMIQLLTVEGDLFNRCELFEMADLDTALARFGELSRHAPHLENAASVVYERWLASFVARDWDAMAEMMAVDVRHDDRRRVVNGGIQRGRDAVIGNMGAVADVGVKNIEFSVIATRGDRLFLGRSRASGDRRLEAFGSEMLIIEEVDADNRYTAGVAYDLDDIDSAFKELDARYLVGEAAAHAHTWSVIAGAFVAHNRRELAAAKPDVVSVDHRRAAAFAPGEGIDYIRAGWDLDQQIGVYIEAVHQVSDIGAVLTWTGTGTSHEGFDAEWRGINVITVDGEFVNRCEIFDEADLDAALAKFDELNAPSSRLENAASRMYDRFNAYLAARDWDAMAEILADHFSADDRRRVVNAGVRHGRDAAIVDARIIADIGFTNMTAAVIATRGERLILTRFRAWGSDREAAQTEILHVVEIDADERYAAIVVFDVDDIDAAFAELDTRYLAGEAADHAHTWSVILGAHAAFNRRELPATAPELVDHRPLVTLEAGDPTAKVREMWDFTPDLRLHIEAIHRLSDLGAVFTQVSHATSQAGFEAEWRLVELVTVDGDMQNRGELFDEAGIDTALARFDELSQPSPRLENAASRASDRFFASWTARDWTALAGILTEDTFIDDRNRPVANVGIWDGRGAVIANLQALAEAALSTTSIVAIRGERVALTRLRSSNRDARYAEFDSEMFIVVEIDSDERIVAQVTFDIEDIDAAFEELDARYVAGEAAAHARTWSLVARTYAGLNRHEFAPATRDWVAIDHRRGIAFDSGEMVRYIRTAWDVAPDVKVYIEEVHRLTNLGAVFTHRAFGTSKDGFDAEWSEVNLVTVEQDMLNRSEIFDAADLDAALERFDELSRPAPRLENAASQLADRCQAHLAAGDWDAMAEMLADDFSNEDRRRVVGGGIRLDRLAHLANTQEIANLSFTHETSTALATRGERLILRRARYSRREQGPDALVVEFLGIVETNADNQIAALVAFDLDDIDAAFEELDARYLAGEAAAHAHTWSVLVGNTAAFNRRELPAAIPTAVNIDHRGGGAAFAPGELMAYLRSTWDLTPQVTIRLEAVHRLSSLGGVVTHVAYGTSRSGFAAEWRVVNVLMFEGDLISRQELFDDVDLDAALARFDELNASAPQRENDAIRTRARLADAINRRDLEGFVALTAADGRYEDRRKGFRDEGPIRNAARAFFATLPLNWGLETEPVAVRGSHLGLTRERYRDTSEADRPITGEALVLTEATDGLARHGILFDPDDINGAFDELTARWIDSGEVAHPDVIEMGRQVNEAYNTHDWDAIAAREADATYVNHRQLISGDVETIVDHWSSIRTLASLIPDLRVEPTEILVHSAIGLVSKLVVKGTTTEGADIELPAITLVIFERDRTTRMEAFDVDQRELALARFEELNRPSGQQHITIIP